SVFRIPRTSASPIPSARVKNQSHARMAPLIPGPLKVPFTEPIARAPWGIAPITWLLSSMFISNVKRNSTSMVAIAISSVLLFAALPRAPAAELGSEPSHRPAHDPFDHEPDDRSHVSARLKLDSPCELGTRTQRFEHKGASVIAHWRTRKQR